MFTKYFFTAMVLSLAMGAFSSESNVVGRYKADAPSDNGTSTAQAGRSSATSSHVGSFATQNQNESNWNTIGQSQTAGRTQSNQSEYATARMYQYAPDSNNMMTHRAPAVDVSAPQATPEKK